ncbi:hypothetical protein K435DRAFT_861182 [Dendrothele bispora CBS 962.96]|uniref:Uncharacterized protein n=1 Tax=Dendrothele bispora (strain CBS 962.96) TaxID=1314807 RepID=A0A4S8LW13_DENBC|nr:hypothetical protein K435DRAFT_861182 [Dendrothele bispora CBS 962.96]
MPGTGEGATGESAGTAGAGIDTVGKGVGAIGNSSDADGVWKPFLIALGVGTIILGIVSIITYQMKKKEKEKEKQHKASPSSLSNTENA